MPYLRIDTNAKATDSAMDAVLKELSAAVARETGKPEGLVQVVGAAGARMLMSGTAEPTAHVSVKGIGLSESQAKALSAALCPIVEKALAVPGGRVFITFDCYKGSMWGKDGATF